MVLPNNINIIKPVETNYNFSRIKCGTKIQLLGTFDSDIDYIVINGT